MLGKISDEKAAWGRLRGFPDRRPVVGVVVVRLDAPLFWANATAIEERLLAEVERWPSTPALVLDLEATTQLDTTSVDVLAHLVIELRQRGVELYLARVLHPANAVLVRSGFFELLGGEHCWHSISQCVRAARRHAGLKGRRSARAAKTERRDDGETEMGEERLAVGIDWVEEVEQLERNSVEVEGCDDGPVSNGARRPLHMSTAGPIPASPAATHTSAAPNSSRDDDAARQPSRSRDPAGVRPPTAGSAPSSYARDHGQRARHGESGRG